MCTMNGNKRVLTRWRCRTRYRPRMIIYQSSSPTWMQSLALLWCMLRTSPANIWQPWSQKADMRKAMPLIRVVELWLKVASENKEIKEIIHSMLYGQQVKTVMQFLLDCSCFPEVVSLRQTSGLNLVTHLFYLTRTWCYSIHRSRMNKLGLYQYR